MATIYKRGGILWLRYYDRGTIYRESLKMNDNKYNRGQAEQIRLKKELELKQRQFAEVTNNRMLSDAFFEFMMEKRIKDTKKSVYYSAMKKFGEYLGHDVFVKNIKKSDLQKFEFFLKDKNKSSNTIFTYLNHISIFSRWLLNKGYITNDFSYKSKPHKKQAKIIPNYAIRKIMLYLRIHSKKQYYFVRFLYLTGFRKQEALNLTWKQVDFENDIIYLENTKAKRTDVFPIYPELKKLLNEIPRNQQKIFDYSSDGLKFYNRALKKLKLNHYSLHDLRRKFGTMMAEQGLTPYELQKIMRHENIKTTMQYYINIDIKNIGNKIKIVPQIVPQTQDN